MVVSLKPGDKTEAQKYALRANMTHGIRLTNADKQRAVKLAIALYPSMSGNEIARLVGVSQPMVSKMKRMSDAVARSTNVADIPNNAAEVRDQSTGRGIASPLFPSDASKEARGSQAASLSHRTSLPGEMGRVMALRQMLGFAAVAQKVYGLKTNKVAKGVLSLRKKLDAREASIWSQQVQSQKKQSPELLFAEYLEVALRVAGGSPAWRECAKTLGKILQTIKQRRAP